METENNNYEATDCVVCDKLCIQRFYKRQQLKDFKKSCYLKIFTGVTFVCECTGVNIVNFVIVY